MVRDGTRFVGGYAYASARYSVCIDNGVYVAVIIFLTFKQLVEI